MSLILEALRKSEAERRRGLPPDLHAELPPPAPPVARALPPWVWIALAAAAIAVIGWLLVRKTEPAPATSPVPEVARQVAPPPAAATPSLPERTPAPPVVATTAPPTQTPPVAAPEPVPAPRPAREPVPPAIIPQPASTPPAPAADSGRVQAVADLDAETRNALPPLKLSMHLWNEDPTQRFVILDGKRVGEGDRIGNASIVRIERDGVLLEADGRGFRIPVD